MYASQRSESYEHRSIKNSYSLSICAYDYYKQGATRTLLSQEQYKKKKLLNNSSRPKPKYCKRKGLLIELGGEKQKEILRHYRRNILWSWMNKFERFSTTKSAGLQYSPYHLNAKKRSFIKIGI